MANKVLLKKSSVADRVPQTIDLDYGELAINYADGKLYFKNSSNAIDYFTSITSTPFTDSFKTIFVAGQSEVVADSPTDTLTLVAGNGIEITTNPAADTITITGGDSSEEFIVVGRQITITTRLTAVLSNYLNYDNITFRTPTGLVVARSGDVYVTG
jgi:hypothetical protein